MPQKSEGRTFSRGLVKNDSVTPYPDPRSHDPTERSSLHTTRSFGLQFFFTASRVACHPRTHFDFNVHNKLNSQTSGCTETRKMQYSVHSNTCGCVQCSSAPLICSALLSAQLTYSAHLLRSSVIPHLSAHLLRSSAPFIAAPFISSAQLTSSAHTSSAPRRSSSPLICSPHLLCSSARLICSAPLICSPHLLASSAALICSPHPRTAVRRSSAPLIC